jgi:hypothetical protein
VNCKSLGIGERWMKDTPGCNKLQYLCVHFLCSAIPSGEVNFHEKESVSSPVDLELHPAGPEKQRQ